MFQLYLGPLTDANISYVKKYNTKLNAIIVIHTNIITNVKEIIKILETNYEVKDLIKRVFCSSTYITLVDEFKANIDYSVIFKSAEYIGNEILSILYELSDNDIVNCQEYKMIIYRYREELTRNK